MPSKSKITVSVAADASSASSGGARATRPEWLYQRMRDAGSGHAAQVAVVRETYAEFGKYGRRNEKDTETAVRTEKLKLPVVYWNVSSFKSGKASKKNISKLSGLLYFDADGHSKEEVLRSRLGPYVRMAWDSSTRTGSGGVVWCPAVSIENISECFSLMQELSGGLLDDSAFQVERANFLSYDPDAYSNENSIPLYVVEKENKGTQFPGTQFSGTQFPGTQFPGTQFSGTQFPGTQFPGTQFPGTQFSGTQFPGTQFPGTQFSGTQFPGTQFPGTQFPGTQFSGTQFQDPFGPDFLYKTYIIESRIENVPEGYDVWYPLSNPPRIAPLAPFFPNGEDYIFFKDGVDTVTLYLKRGKIEVGKRFVTLFALAKNFFFLHPAIFNEDSVFTLYARVGKHLAQPLPRIEIKNLYDELEKHRRENGGFVPDVVKRYVLFNPESKLSETEMKSIAATLKQGGDASRNAADVAEFVRDYSGGEKITARLVSECVGLGIRTAKKYCSTLKKEIKAKNEELGLYKTKKSRTGSFKEPEAKSDAKRQPEYESSPRVAGYAQEDNNACVEEPEFKYSFCDTLKLNIVAKYDN